MYIYLTDFKARYSMKCHEPVGDLNGPVLKDLMNNKNQQLDELQSIQKMKVLDLSFFKNI